MSKFLDKPSSDTLYRAIVSLQDEDECRFRICAPFPS